MALSLLAIWLLSGVGALDALRYLGYLGVFVLAPGCLLERLLRPSARAPLDRLATGWALGYALELALFALTAELDARSLLPWLILAVAAVCALALVRGRVVGRSRPAASARAGNGSPGFGWGVAALAILAVAYLAVAYFPISPLPGTVPSVTYYADFPFHLGIAAEALHHWPIGDPKVSGTSLPYHVFVYMHLASVAQITGLGLPLILLRLDIPTLLVAFVVALAAAGRAITGRAAVGLIAVVLVLFVAELHPNPDAHFTFLNTFFYSEYTSPTFLFGLVLFVPAVQVLIELVTAERPTQTDVRPWIVLIVLVAACGGAKATIIPVLLGGTALAVFVRALTDRRISAAAVAVLGILAVAFAIYQLTLYRGFNGGVRFNPPGSVRLMDVMALIRSHIPGGALAALFWIVAVPLGIIGFCGAPMIGVAGVVGRPLRTWPFYRVLLASLFLAGFVPFLILWQFGSSQNFFTYYGYVAGCVLSAEGLVILWQRWVGRPGWPAARAASIGVLGVAATVGAVYGIRALVSAPLTRYAVWFAALVLALLVATAFAARSPRGLRGRATMGIIVGILLFGALEAPLETVPPLVSALAAGRPTYNTSSGLLTRALYRGLVWVKDHTSPSAVLAVNNQYVGSARRVPGYMYYSAFTERRVFLEGWAYTTRANELGAEAVTFGGLPAFPGRLALNRAVFEQANPRALARMTRAYGVRYLLVDRVHGSATSKLARVGRIVYDSPSMIVYRVA